MNWLEIGCPYCPTVLTVPRGAAGRNVRCPECGKTYIVPEPKQAEAALAMSSPRPSLPIENAYAALEPTVAATAMVTTPPQVPAAAARTAPVRQQTSDDGMEPVLDAESPLPEIEILAPPPARSPSPAIPPVGNSLLPGNAMPSRPVPPQPRAEPATQTLPAARAPLPQQSAATQRDERLDEVQERILRDQRRARMNLIIFVVGIFVMTSFAFVVSRFTRRS